MIKHDLFFLGPKDTIHNDHIELSDKIEVNHIANVMRKRQGDIITISDGYSHYYVVELDIISKRSISAKILETHPVNNKYKNIKLYVSLLKGHQFDLQLEKAIEIGVGSIHPIITDHVIANKSKVEKWSDGIKTALKQSKQAHLVKIDEPVKLKSLVKSDNELWIVPELIENTVPFTSLSIDGKDLCLFIGPEGGFSKTEHSLFEKNNASFHSLGSNRLRAETATWVSLTLLHNLIKHY